MEKIKWDIAKTEAEGLKVKKEKKINDLSIASDEVKTEYKKLKKQWYVPPGDKKSLEVLNHVVFCGDCLAAEMKSKFRMRLFRVCFQNFVFDPNEEFDYSNNANTKLHRPK